eukprot:TRINITY_DN6849_c0_g1_i2.p1 TRINITY_DN6849_c0_g1~~TRINITY_DN6849_c0_g1_i2.p1  ORF type:complete len:849 (-),score=139.11 TRINITY_DN6849_c0_g1_i2:34-2580(-)
MTKESEKEAQEEVEEKEGSANKSTCREDEQEHEVATVVHGEVEQEVGAECSDQELRRGKQEACRREEDHESATEEAAGSPAESGGQDDSQCVSCPGNIARGVAVGGGADAEESLQEKSEEVGTDSPQNSKFKRRVSELAGAQRLQFDSIEAVRAVTEEERSRAEQVARIRAEDAARRWPRSRKDSKVTSAMTKTPVGVDNTWRRPRLGQASPNGLMKKDLEGSCSVLSGIRNSDSALSPEVTRALETRTMSSPTIGRSRIDSMSVSPGDVQYRLTRMSTSLLSSPASSLPSPGGSPSTGVSPFRWPSSRAASGAAEDEPRSDDVITETATEEVWGLLRTVFAHYVGPTVVSGGGLGLARWRRFLRDAGLLAEDSTELNEGGFTEPANTGASEVGEAQAAKSPKKSPVSVKMIHGVAPLRPFVEPPLRPALADLLLFHAVGAHFEQNLAQKLPTVRSFAEALLSVAVHCYAPVAASVGPNSPKMATSSRGLAVVVSRDSTMTTDCGASESTSTNGSIKPLPNVGTRVRARYDGAMLPGIVRYVGPLHVPGKAGEGEWAGVELDSPRGKHDGYAGEQRYFECEPRHGLFCRAKAIEEVKEIINDANDVLCSPVPSPDPCTQDAQLVRTMAFTRLVDEVLRPLVTRLPETRVVLDAAGLVAADRGIGDLLSKARPGLVAFFGHYAVGKPRDAADSLCKGFLNLQIIAKIASDVKLVGELSHAALGRLFLETTKYEVSESSSMSNVDGRLTFEGFVVFLVVLAERLHATLRRTATERLAVLFLRMSTSGGPGSQEIRSAARSKCETPAVPQAGKSDLSVASAAVAAARAARSLKAKTPRQSSTPSLRRRGLP